jgi:hypothetical protein
MWRMLPAPEQESAPRRTSLLLRTTDENQGLGDAF